MITTVILFIIYFAFISLGLPDSVLGAALPAISRQWGLQLSDGSLASMLIVGSTVVSSFMSGHIIEKVGTGRITFLSCLLTAGALMGISFAPAFLWLLILAVPLGLGGGAVDSALNNYVAVHYESRHMNWIHSFWGVGATLGPVLMSFSLSTFGSWQSGYRLISIIQFVFTLVLLFSLPLWKKADRENQKKTEDPADGRDAPEISSVESTDRRENVFRIKGVWLAFVFLILYSVVEGGLGLWGSSFLVQSRGFSIERAAFWISFYFGGITLGRFLSGFISMKLNNTQMLRGGLLIALGGLILIALPLPKILTVAAMILTGFGLAPVFPAMLHETPNRFGRSSSQILIGYQMGFAYLGSTLLNPLLGVILQLTNPALLPWILMVLSFLMIFTSGLLIAVTNSGDTVGYEH
ncbi:MAG: MFS transporter [Spirochaetales bacterium]|nr:MFS transporter [Spirochaetales bacterium]